jgi:diguanylate cyclase (GGDEF)-like protein
MKVHTNSVLINSQKQKLSLLENKRLLIVELLNVNACLISLNDEIQKIAGKLLSAKNEIKQRTMEIEEQASEHLSENKRLDVLIKEKDKYTKELSEVNKKLIALLDEIDIIASELFVASQTLESERKEKAKYIAKLQSTNKELASQYEEKAMRHAELLIANKELAFQNEEKAKRHAELLIANKELAFQKEEKAKRHAELLIANKELAYQNEEKAKRAAELLIVNEELVFQYETQKKKEEKILYISNHDYLTDLFNRRYYNESFNVLNNASNYPLGIMMFDVNGLKIINDAYGHNIGDQAIKEAGTALKEIFEMKDIVARIGGDEFAVLSPNTTLEKMQSYKEALRLRLTKTPIKNIILTLAMGYEIITDSGKTLDEILKTAENHMYRHKIAEGVSVRNRTIQAILNTLTEKNKPEKIHSEKVSLYCLKIGEALTLQPDDLKELALAGMFHDIGKSSIPDALLEKPGKLTMEEFEIIKTHTEIGYQILRAADQYSDLAIHALCHHERWDGKGYPHGLKGVDIPLYSRIICVADAFEAMTTERPYKKSMTIENGIEELKRCSSTQFDPAIVKIFIEQVLL